MRKLTQYIRSPITVFSWLESKASINSKSINKNDDLSFSHIALDIALDIATTKDLTSECSRLLLLIENFLNSYFTEEEGSQLYLVVSDKKNEIKPNIIHSKNNTPDPIFITKLGYHLSLCDTSFLNQSDCKDKHFSLPNIEGNFYSKKLLIEDKKQAWLVFAFHNKMPSLTHIQHYSSQATQAISRGLDAFFSKQKQIDQAVTTERASQAAELHDSIAQILGYLRLKTSQLVSHCQASHYQTKYDTELQALSRDIAYQTHSAYRSTRELISTSRLSTQNKTLSECIREAIEEFEQQSNVVFELDNRIIPTNTASNHETKEQEAQLQFIVREALSNIARHSHATHARVQLNSDGHYLTITIEDNGNGIQEANKRHDSFGLQIMQERATKISAIFCIKGRIPHGTIVEIKHTLPKESLSKGML
jgi:nitrate/nitrite-specific signal transduction histidine kinase